MQPSKSSNSFVVNTPLIDNLGESMIYTYKLTSTIGVAKVVVANRIEAKISDKTAIVII